MQCNAMQCNGQREGDVEVATEGYVSHISRCFPLHPSLSYIFFKSYSIVWHHGQLHTHQLIQHKDWSCYFSDILSHFKIIASGLLSLVNAANFKERNCSCFVGGGRERGCKVTGKILVQE